MKPNMKIITLLLVASVFSALIIITIKYYVLKSYNYLLLVAVLLSCCLIYTYVELLQIYDTFVSFTLIKIISILLVLLSSSILFGSKLTMRKLVGLFFGFIAIYLMK
jgi:drug/metabolite transporter (DMT)-like permease